MFKPFPEIDNIHTIAIPFPDFPDLISVNVYAIGKGPVTLIDTGPNLPGTLDFIREQLKLAGLGINEIERIIITHGHPDHFGLAVGIREAAGHHIDCFIHSEDKWRASSAYFQQETWAGEQQKWMAMVGMPVSVMKKVMERFSFFKKLCDPLDEVSTMEDGVEFIGEGYHLKVIHTPGHSAGTCCLYEPQQKILFSGDHILKHITPNPLAEIKRDHLRDPNYQSLEAYITSLDKLAGLDVSFVFPGHGEHIEDLPDIISAYKGHHRERMDMVWNALKKNSRPLYQLIEDVFPYVPENDVFLAVSEILVHLEILIKEDRAELADAGPPALYRVFK